MKSSKQIWQVKWFLSIHKHETETTMEEGQLHYLATLTVPLNVINQYVPCMTSKGSL